MKAPIRILGLAFCIALIVSNLIAMGQTAALLQASAALSPQRLTLTPQSSALRTIATTSVPIRALDSTLPQPTIRLRLHPQPSGGYRLQIQTTDFTFSNDHAATPAGQAVGYAQFYLNGRLIERLTAPWVTILADQLSPGLNDAVVTLHAPDGALWQVNGLLLLGEVRFVNGDPAQVGNSNATGGALTYTLRWQWGKASPGPQGVGWQVVTDRGDWVWVKRGYLVTGNLEMVACPYQPASSALGNNLWQTLFGARTAYAGHGGDKADASRIAAPVVEALTMPTTTVLSAVLGAEPFYCLTHYLVAPDVDWGPGLPQEVNMVGVTLFLEGEVKVGSRTDAVAHAFTIQSNLAWGTLKEVLQTSNQAESSPVAIPQGAPTQLVVERSLGTLFDGVDFATMSAAEQAKTILRNVTNTAQIYVSTQLAIP